MILWSVILWSINGVLSQGMLFLVRMPWAPAHPYICGWAGGHCGLPVYIITHKEVSFVLFLFSLSQLHSLTLLWICFTCPTAPWGGAAPGPV
uniref:Uncharacterized protein n=1 Tax=Pyxicephalus adspersus TaxID=30357 RepID=A0AAV2ZSA7_PYXAD|nr:TPA: hypothetical protein GDO54_004688 [Pyxicephalus adspersus]